jgi:LPS-assembly protein
MMLLPPDSKDTLPLFIEADEVRGHTDRETEAEGDVRLRKRGKAFFSDWMRHDKEKDELTAIGKVRIEQENDTVEGDRLRYNLETERGFMEKPNYTFRPGVRGATPGQDQLRFGDTDGRGKAERLLFEGPQQYRAENASYTTCGPGNDDWYVKARELDIDKGRDVGVARGASIVFMDQTIFYSPYLSFSLHRERKSGFLTPHYGTSNSSGLEFTTPYYWNIAPNMDATFYPRYMTKRGAQLRTEFRYLDPAYRGDAYFEFLPGDQQLHQDRYGYFWKHSQAFSTGWGTAVNVNRVSDAKYFTDLSSIVAVTSQSVLSNDVTLARGGSWAGSGTYALSAVAQRWQTLQNDPLAPLTPPYDRLPQISFSAFRPEILRSDLDFVSSYVNFRHPTLASGERAIAYPSLSLPLQNAYGYVTPKLGVHATRYIMDPSTTRLGNSTRTIPIFSTEGGVTFERDAMFTGLPFTQTLEPKIYYLYIPFRNQTGLPNFESGVQDINFATIFSENQFSGQDRINDANQVTVGLSSRFIQAENGIERLRVGVAQRYYFQSQQVTVPGAAPRPNQTMSSDMLAVLSGTVARAWTAEAGWQFNTDLSQTQKFNAATRYQPETGRVLNLAYRNTINLVKQTDVSFQWPVGNHWSAVGRWNWSILDRRTLEGVAGLEYDGGCWAFRIVGHRFATTTQTANTTLFMQLELNGVSRIGSNPMDILRRNIGGYRQLDPRLARPQDQYTAPDR